MIITIVVVINSNNNSNDNDNTNNTIENDNALLAKRRQVHATQFKQLWSALTAGTNLRSTQMHEHRDRHTDQLHRQTRTTDTSCMTCLHTAYQMLTLYMICLHPGFQTLAL